MSGKLEEFTEIPVQPLYKQTKVNEPIPLGEFEVQAIDGDSSGQTNASATLQLLPREKLEILVPFADPTNFASVFERLSRSSEVVLKRVDNDVALPVLWTRSSNAAGGTVYQPRTTPLLVTPHSSSLSRAVFHVFNFPEFIGPEDYVLHTIEPGREGFSRIGRVFLRADGWRIAIWATSDTKQLSAELKDQGGFAITHVGEIQREDGSCFTSEQLDDLLVCLQYFLSFSLGRWAGVALPVGFGTSGDRLYERWGLPTVATGAWFGDSSWFDAHHSELLPQIFAGFMERWKDSMWRDVLCKSLYFYFSASERGVGIGVDTGLILAQVALERLAWTYCVQFKKMVSAQAFKNRGLPAADKLRILASSLGLPLEIPAGLTSLAQSQQPKWCDSFEAITAVRNSFVHPDTKLAVPHHVYFEAWKLSLWYLDLALLRICEHNGKYANRLAQRWTGDVEQVPWAKGDCVSLPSQPSLTIELGSSH